MMILIELKRPTLMEFRLEGYMQASIETDLREYIDDILGSMWTYIHYDVIQGIEDLIWADLRLSSI